MAWPESVSLVILFFVREIAFLGSSFTTHFYSLKRPMAAARVYHLRFRGLHSVALGAILMLLEAPLP